ncbi:WD repeat-containing protein 55 isoform X2 [Cavia porcellus]|uniref:WD repeat-containing protein 55 isoform X2 n=1 Tax=Cavia porcellus TaxID=10141 RepID=UPI000350DC4F|nr:WD repeat-containing protein 55 isoform X2 [Cavia porcellus]
MDSTCEERPANDGSDEEDSDSTEAPARIRDTPEDIVLEAPASGLAFHPTRDLLAAGDVDGDVFVAPINSLLLVDENVLATGDDSGGVRLWDQRKEGPLMDMRQHEEYIADMALDPAKKLLLTASGDGCLGVFNIKRRRFELLSEPQSGDLTSVTLMKCGKKVACGSSEGTIYLFNWNGFGATSDRFALRAESIDCMVPVTESLLCTGSTDGIIRAVNILPNRVVGSVGQHAGEPVEELALSHCGRFLASSGHDQHLKFWDMAQLRTVVVDDYRRRKKKGGPLRALSNKAWSTDDFFAGLREEEDTKGPEEESEDDSD